MNIKDVEAVPMCGAWCGDAAEAATPCAIDKTKRVCEGYFCSTTCGLWEVMMLGNSRSQNTSCEMFIRGEAYPWGAQVCNTSCLFPETRADRYPSPTGVGFLCRPGTCDPAAQSKYAPFAEQEGLAVMQCPCNWFGADCRDDWVPVRAIRKNLLGDLQATVFSVDAEGWKRVMRAYQPGAVIRVQHVTAIDEDAAGRPRGTATEEQPYALANDLDGTAGELEVLTAAPPEDLHETKTEVARRVRALPEGPVSNLYVNPAIGGFFNKRYTFLSSALATAGPALRHVVVVATGSGLSGAMGAIRWALRSTQKLHLYYGIRDARHLPYRGLLEHWAGTKLRLTLLVSSKDASARRFGPGETALSGALERGERVVSHAAFASATSVAPLLPQSGKVYAQHALGLDLAAGALRSAGATLANSAVVVCGRVELLYDTEAMLRAACSEGEACEGLVAEHMFTNI